MSEAGYNSDFLLGDPNDVDQIVEGEEDDNDAVEGNEGEDQNGDENRGDDDAPTPVVPKKTRVVKNPQPKLDPVRLCGPRGIATLQDVFKDMKFHGKGHEKADLDRVMKRLGHWAHRLFPKFQFDDCLEKIEKLGHKRQVITFVKKIRMDMETFHQDVDAPLTNDVGDDDHQVETQAANLSEDVFDQLLNQQQTGTDLSQPVNNSSSQSDAILSDEVRERMLRNRLIAEERRLARLKAQQEREKKEAENKREESVVRENNIEDQSVVSSDYTVISQVLVRNDDSSSEDRITCINAQVLPEVTTKETMEIDKLLLLQLVIVQESRMLRILHHSLNFHLLHRMAWMQMNV